MLSDLSIVQFIVVQASFAFSPGLIIALIVNESIQNSRRKGFEVAGGATEGYFSRRWVAQHCSQCLKKNFSVIKEFIYIFNYVFFITNKYIYT